MKGCLFLVFITLALTGFSQFKKEDVFTDFVFYNKRQRLDKDLRENTIAKTFGQELTKENEHRFESACWAISQFQFKNADVEKGFSKLYASYDSLEFDTKRAYIEASFAMYPTEYVAQMKTLLTRETHPKLFAMQAVYLYRLEPSIEMQNNIMIRMVEQFPDYENNYLLLALQDHIQNANTYKNAKTPSLKDLMVQFAKLKLKVVYSFQRWDRDQPGMALVQNADGSIVKRADGRPMLFEQLARSGSSLPYFLTNGNSPQGIYSITGTAVARNNFIGPTPNLQMIMPFEDSMHRFYHHIKDPISDTLNAYLDLLPESWKNYLPIRESYTAGRIGRTEIIAHGTTLDPEYFKDKPYYPLTPTLGCLCAKELWNVTSGRLLVSEQFNLYSAFTSTAGQKGFLLVINLDNQNKPVTREEVERLLTK